MGHADTRMVERVHGRLPVEDLRRRLARAKMVGRDGVVPGGGIEPPTRGSSGLVREWPRPREPLEKRRRPSGAVAESCQGSGETGQLALPFDVE